MNAQGGPRGSRRDPEDLERDNEAIRADMDRTLEELESRFSPREMVDRSLEYVREHGAEIAARVGETVRSNPIPVALTTAGLVWLTASVVRQRRDLERDLAFADEEDEDDNGRFYDADEFEREDDWQDMSETEYAGGSEDTEVSMEADEESESSAAPRVIRHRLMRSAGTVRRRVGEVSRSAARSVAEQPVFWGVLALAAGALLGSALPASEYEKRALSMRPPRGDGAARPPAEGTSEAGTENPSQAGKESAAYGA